MRQEPAMTIGIATTTIDFTSNNTPPPELEELGQNLTTSLKMTAEDVLQGDSETASKRVEQVIEDVSHLPEAMARFEQQMVDTIEALLPGVQNRKSTRITLPLVVTLSVVWLAFYFTQVYEPDDPRDQYDSWNNSDKFKELEDKEKQRITDELSELPEPETTLERESVAYMKANPPNNVLQHADLVFVFHNPEYPYADSEEEINSKELKKMLLGHKQSKRDMAETGMKPFAEIHDLLNQGLDQLKGDDDDDDDIDDLPTTEEEKTGITGGLKAKAQELGKMSKRSMVILGEKAKHALNQHKIAVTKKEARIAVIQDMWTWAENNGFSVDIFSSIDSDELFLCVSMRRSIFVRFYLQEARTELQIQQHVVKNLNIDQDPEDPCSSPPFVVYDKRTVKSLYESYVDDAENDQRVIPEKDDKALFRAFYDRDSRGSVMSSKDRIFAILQVLNKDVDLESAKTVGVLLDWYPTHSELFLEKLKEAWTPYPGYLAEQLWVQPVTLIKDYFGSQIAFSFAWQGLHLKGLLGLTAIAMMVEFFKYGPRLLVNDEMMQERQMLPFSIVIMIWARVMLNLWENEQEFLTELWNMNTEHGLHIERPSFKGVLATSEVNAQEMEEVIPKSERIFLRVSSTLVTVFCCAVVFSVIGLWVFMQRGRMDLVSSVALSMFIKIAEFSYNALSAKLAEYENHKYEDAFHDCWAWQQFMFQAVNTYWACAAIAMAQIMHGQCGQDEHREKAGEETCWGSLKIQLTMLMLILMGCSVAFLGLEWILVKINFWSEEQGLAKGHPPDQAKRVLIERSYLEEQSKSNHFGTREQIENKLQLVLGLGFVLLFGTLQPLVVPLCLIHFAITVEIRAHLLLHYTKRCVPHRLAGIGAWREVVILLMNVSVFSNGFLLITWGRFLKGGSLIAKLTGLIFWIVLVSVLWAIVDMVVPRQSAEAELLEKRRNYVKRVLTETCMDEQDDRRRETPKMSNADAASGQADTSFAKSSLGLSSWRLRGNPEYSNTQTFMDPHTRRAVHVHMQPEDVREKETLQSRLKTAVQDNEWDQIPTLSGRRVFPKKEYIRRSDTMGVTAGADRRGQSWLFGSSPRGSQRT
jgi:hypothetical protein